MRNPQSTQTVRGQKVHVVSCRDGVETNVGHEKMTKTCRASKINEFFYSHAIEVKTPRPLPYLPALTIRYDYPLARKTRVVVRFRERMPQRTFFGRRS